MNFKLASIVIAGFGLLSSGAAHSQNCKSPATQSDMNQCAAAEFSREDARLNTTYNALRKGLDTATKARLKDVQLAWIKYKDLACKLEASSVEGGSLYPLVLSSCLTRITRQRNKELQELRQEGAL